MTIFRIILAILAFVGIFFLAHQLDKKQPINTYYNAMCIGGIVDCGIILGLCLGLLLG